MADILESDMAAIFRLFHFGFIGFAILETLGRAYNLRDIDEKLNRMAAILEFKMTATRGISRFGSNRFMTPMVIPPCQVSYFPH
jgi:hypothetical protein